MATRFHYRPGDSVVSNFFHCVSRVVDRRFIFEGEEREFFIGQMRRYAAWGGLRVVTYCVMSNHFHILVEVPPRPMGPDGVALSMDEAAFLAHVAGSLGAGAADGYRGMFEMYRGNGCEAVIGEVIKAVEARMYDVSAYMQSLKRVFSAWYNKRMGRKGTLWEERFRSVLVEGAGDVLATMAAYIDLNPVRAGLVKEPEEYPWSGYGEAVLGVKEALAGLGFVAELLGLDPAEGSENDVKARNRWHQAVLARYRVWLYGEGQEILAVDGKGGRVGFTLEEIEAVRVAGGVLSLPQRLRLKVRHFTDGGAVGSKGFVDAVFGMWRDRFGKNRKTGARKLRGADWGELRVLRDLQR